MGDLVFKRIKTGKMQVLKNTLYMYNGNCLTSANEDHERCRKNVDIKAGKWREEKQLEKLGLTYIQTDVQV